MLWPGACAAKEIEALSARLGEVGVGEEGAGWDDEVAGGMRGAQLAIRALSGEKTRGSPPGRVATW